MADLEFPRPFRHDHPPVRDVNAEFDSQLDFGQRASDALVALVGSWRFIIAQTTVLALWAVLNLTAWILHWDPYPFILLNLFLSMLAAIQAPVIMMSQNRQDTKDRLRGELDYDVNRRAESEIQGLASKLNLLRDKIEDMDELLRRRLP